ncbi:uncharacterized protein LOC131160671 [Malania oleifera]|uniref:uncharacterized protein LOC131160671 n=1 Tax=Malania oleifera TaxID=397392 RepID=UPI0025AE750A|nr:uncharacterized protein LOC131160671 [Malania oleifera]
MVSSEVQPRTNRFLLCFRPVVMDPSSVHPGAPPDDAVSSGEPVFAYFSVGNKDRAVLPTIISALSDDGGETGRRKKSADRKFSRIVKAVLFEKSLVKKLRNRKSQQNSSRSNGSLSSKFHRVFNSFSERTAHQQHPSENDDQRVHSKSSSLPLNSSPTAIPTPTCSSSPSTPPSDSRPFTEPKRTHRSHSIQSRHRHSSCEEGSRNDSTSALFLLAVSLLVLVCWGKICAIVCTSTWLFFVPRRRDLPENGKETPVVDSVEYKKRVIMEGLLERTRNRG